MRTRYRNRAIKLLGLAGLMILVLVILVAFRKHGIPDGVIDVSAVALGIGGLIFYLQGCMALAEAKGHNGGVVAGIVVIGYLFSMIGSCVAPVARVGFLGLFLLMPVVLLFGIKDKYKVR